MWDFKTSYCCCQRCRPVRWGVPGVFLELVNPGSVLLIPLLCTHEQTLAPAGSRHPVWAENSHPELWNGVNRPNDSSDNSRDEQRPSVPAMAELVHHLGPPKCFQTLWGHCKFWLLAWNAEMQRENCKINFRYYLFSQNTTSLLVMVLLFYGFYGFMECGFREASAACRWVLVLPLIHVLWTSDSWSVPAAGREDEWGLAKADESKENFSLGRLLSCVG